MWVTQSPLLQLPYLDLDTVAELKRAAKVEDIVDFMNMDDTLRQKLLNVNETQMGRIAEVCNRYPNIEMEFDLDKAKYADGDSAEMTVTIKRPDVEDEEELAVFANPVFA
jgi:pre-mRNA-splicing helicase BRR2